MRCPSCLAILQEPVDACPACGFTLAALDKKFGTVPKNYRFVTDLALYFEQRERDTIEKKLADIERSFPGLYISVMTMEVHPGFKPREYLFWLMNRCQFAPRDCRLERSFALVLFFDSSSRTILLTTGYALERSLPEEVLQTILDAAIPHFKKENFHRGTMAILDDVKHHLKRFCSAGLSEPPATLKSRGEVTKKPEDLF